MPASRSGPPSSSTLTRSGSMRSRPCSRRTGVASSRRRARREAALAAVEEHRPDLLRDRDRSGRAAGATGSPGCARVLERAPEAKAVVLSRHEEPELIDAALRAGRGRVRDQDRAPGRPRLGGPPGLRPLGLPRPAGRAHIPRTRAALGARHGLTARELEILRLLIEGHSNAQLAHMLWVTEQTVKFHLSNIYRKLGVAEPERGEQAARLAGMGAGESAAPAPALSSLRRVSSTRGAAGPARARTPP